MPLLTNSVSVLGRLAGIAYDTGMGGQNWRALTDAIASTFDTLHATIVTDMVDRGTGPLAGIGYASIREPCVPAEGTDPLIERAWRLPRGDISLVQRMHENRAMADSAFYRSAVAGNRLGHAIHAMLPVHNGTVAFFCITRASFQPVFSHRELDVVRALLPHLSRALQVSERPVQQARATLFDAMPYGAVFLDSAGKIRDMNRAAQKLVSAGDGISIANGQVRLAGNRIDLSRVIEKNLDSAGRIKPLAFQIDRAYAGHPLSAMLSPMQQDWKRAFDADDIVAVLILADPLLTTYPDASTLIDQYGLTISEARFSQTLVRSRALNAASVELGISRETARRHVKSIFEKTQTHSQAELIHLLVRHPSAIFSGVDLDTPALDLPAAAE